MATSQYQYLLYRCRPSCLLLCGWAASLYLSVYTLTHRLWYLQNFFSPSFLHRQFPCPLPREVLSSELVHQSKNVDLLLFQFDHVILHLFSFSTTSSYFPKVVFSLSGQGQNHFWHVCFKDSWQSVRKYWWARDGWPAIKVKSVGVELGTSRLHVSLTDLSRCLEG